MMKSKIPSPLVTFEMANNHMGDVSHGERIIREFSVVAKKYPEFSFAFKLQYRNLDTFIHPSVRERQDIKHVKRFNETKLSRSQFDYLIDIIRKVGFISMVTPFDEDSVGVIEEQGIEIIKIASCSFNDWPLLERVAKTEKPLIASTAGASVESLDGVISFLTHRKKDFSILHCVAEYPAPAHKMELNQIDFLRDRYPGVRIGFSTHEAPGDTEIVKIATAKGADIFEKHVGIGTTQYALNAYSAAPPEVESWLEAIRATHSVCGHRSMRSPVNEAEQASLLSLRRGAFARGAISAGSRITPEMIYFAFPPEDNQVTANEWGKYVSYTTTRDVETDAPLLKTGLEIRDDRQFIREIATRVRYLLREGNISVPGGVDLEISHHYGLEKFNQYGLTLLTVINREYCKKLLVCLPGQQHPEQYHKLKEETFHVLHGELEIKLDGAVSSLRAGDVVTIEPMVRHEFSSATGAVIEEISSTHFPKDSYYTDETITHNMNRKTILTYWMD